MDAVGPGVVSSPSKSFGSYALPSRRPEVWFNRRARTSRVLNLEFGTNTAVRVQLLDLAGKRKVAIISHTIKDQLLHLVSNHEPGEPFKLDELMERQLTEDSHK